MLLLKPSSDCGADEGSATTSSKLLTPFGVQAEREHVVDDPLFVSDNVCPFSWLSGLWTIRVCSPLLHVAVLPLATHVVLHARTVRVRPLFEVTNGVDAALTKRLSDEYVTLPTFVSLISRACAWPGTRFVIGEATVALSVPVNGTAPPATVTAMGIEIVGEEKLSTSTEIERWGAACAANDTPHAIPAARTYLYFTKLYRPKSQETLQ